MQTHEPLAELTLWDWAAHAYAAPGVSAACLALQDDSGQSVDLLLWSAWAAIEGRSPSPAALVAAADLAWAWEALVIGPLRVARRNLKASSRLGGSERSALRAEVAGAELAAERALLAALEALTPAASGRALDPALAMAAASAAWGRRAPDAALSALAAAFPRA
jgi:uncharacterized protein (TIGR02444 family)